MKKILLIILFTSLTAFARVEIVDLQIYYVFECYLVQSNPNKILCDVYLSDDTQATVLGPVQIGDWVEIERAQ